MRLPAVETLTTAALRRIPTWRPPLPQAVIDRALLRERGGVHPWHPDPARTAPSYSVRSIQRTREAMERTQRIMDPAPRDLKRDQIQLPNCTAERLRVPESRAGRVILYFHGGAFLRGSTDTHIGAIARFMRASRCEAVSVDYRMAPEHQHPAWVDDAVDAYRHLTGELGITPDHIAVGGDSAGGSLALALLQRLHTEGLPQPAAAFVVSPWADLTCSGPSHTENSESEVMFGPGVIPHCAQWLADQAGVATDDPLFSPAFGTYTADMPPLRIDVSTIEQLRSDAHRVEDAYRAGGATATLHEHPTAPHAWTAIGTLSAARQTAKDIGRFIDDHLS
ncbi:MAG: alpha/beta hydrolase [Solirubrobacteraceae bacterium]|nr:alpha/beta hydrolase [Solirubrobacteraceae bacterium]